MNNTPDTSHYDKCLSLSNKLRRSHSIRSFLLLILCVLNGYCHTITLPIVKGMETTPETSYARNAIFTMGFPYAVAALFCLIAVMLLGFLLRQEKGKLLLIPIGITVLCVVTGLFHIFWGILIALVLAYGLYESHDARWLREQEGYPYFNERFAEQNAALGQEYVSRYDIRSQKDSGSMADIGNEYDSGNIDKSMQNGGFYE
ncbi:MAG: hypothetical protein IJ265_12775 [Oscillospiraceae bacterium]|nr:hypothetical protein [Oscillospiraceae bacterium]